MARRYRDWFEQAKRDLELSRTAKNGGWHEWACFAAQQAGEKAIKALFDYLAGEGCGHSLTKLLEDLPHELAAPSEIQRAAQQLDRLYIPTRYPNGFDAGKPGDYFNKDDSDAAIDQAQRVLAWVEEHLSR